jgi:hypothetical protein
MTSLQILLRVAAELDRVTDEIAVEVLSDRAVDTFLNVRSTMRTLKESELGGFNLGRAAA